MSQAVTHPSHRDWDEGQIALIKQTVARDASDGELMIFLSLAAKYDLDPLAGGEIWFAKSKSRNGEQGRLLMMVGRDGLRKIAMKAGLRIDADVVHEKDLFKVVRKDGRREIHHEYEGGKEERGAIIGAWCEVRRGPVSINSITLGGSGAGSGPLHQIPGEVVGFSFAPIAEYRPTSESKLKYSPWGSQESVMILAAAERNALRQATPLSGLLAEGEGVINEEIAEGPVAEADVTSYTMPDDVPDELARRFEAAIKRANEMEPNTYTPENLSLLAGDTVEGLASFVEQAEVGQA